MTLANLLKSALILSLFFGCKSIVNLEPTDNRPVKSIQVSDADEVAIIEQEMDIEIKYVKENTLYFYTNNQETLSSLEDIGYQINEISPMQTSFRLVKIISKDDMLLSVDKNDSIRVELEQYNIKILKREDTYWAIHGSLENLTSLPALGYKIEDLDSEVRPRSIKIIVPTSEDVQKVNEMHVDIYSSGPDQEVYIIYGGAYDYQIDMLESAGYEVSIEN